jgi:S1-C subfamily serine protease
MAGSRLRVMAAAAMTALINAACGASATSAPAESRGHAAGSPTAASSGGSPVASLPAVGGGLTAVEKATVLIQAEGTFVTPDGAQEEIVTGSGFLIDPSGLIVTNNHVVTGGAFWKVTVGDETATHDAQVLGVSECSDLAVIKIDGGGYPTLSFASAVPQVGDHVYAAGHPGGDAYTLTDGIVSKAPEASDQSWASIKQEIQHTAQIRPGSSGGPLVDTGGRVVGVNYAGNDKDRTFFAIAASEASSIVDQLKQSKDVTAIGINGDALPDGSGIFVESVKSGSPADKAGVKAGDLLTKLAGLSVGIDGTKKDYCSILRSHPATDVMDVEVSRGGQVLQGQLNGREMVASAGQPTPAAGTSAPSGDTGALLSVIPDAIASTCTSSDKPNDSVVVSVFCQPSGNADGLWYDLYPDAASLNKNYEADRKFFGVTRDDGTCGSTATAEGPYTITFSDGSKLQGDTYRLMCWKDDKGAWLEWADPAIKVMATAHRKDGDQTTLHDWWKTTVTSIDPHP